LTLADADRPLDLAGGMSDWKERTTAGVKLSVVRGPDQQRRARCAARCEERDGPAAGEE